MRNVRQHAATQEPPLTFWNMTVRIASHLPWRPAFALAHRSARSKQVPKAAWQAWAPNPQECGAVSQVTMCAKQAQSTAGSASSLPKSMAAWQALTTQKGAPTPAWQVSTLAWQYAAYATRAPSIDKATPRAPTHDKAAVRTPKSGTGALSRHHHHKRKPALVSAPKPTLAYSNVPIEGHHGRWLGKRGDSTWASTHPQVLRVTGGCGIAFVAGYPDFQPWAVAAARFEIGVLLGTSNDARKADSQWGDALGCDASAARQLRKERGSVWHHVEDCRTLYLLPSLLHGNIPHAGGAVLLRQARRATRLPCSQP